MLTLTLADGTSNASPPLPPVATFARSSGDSKQALPTIERYVPSLRQIMAIRGRLDDIEEVGPSYFLSCPLLNFFAQKKQYPKGRPKPNKMVHG